jgi:hypothetical protein
VNGKRMLGDSDSFAGSEEYVFPCGLSNWMRSRINRYNVDENQYQEGYLKSKLEGTRSEVQFGMMNVMR